MKNTFFQLKMNQQKEDMSCEEMPSKKKMIFKIYFIHMKYKIF